ncbi:BNR-4 repeat-containing protein [Candidatus Sumerlaeota bacterium]|nr:BNR-4 repeat-containing protein [Candidatus Sumerlaeota bacterium]
MLPIMEGWARNSVNGVIFRKNSIVTYRDTQYVAFYDAQGRVVLAKRTLGAVDWEIRVTQYAWEIRTTEYTGNTKDAHNTICIMADGEGYLHMAWDQHNNSLHYCRSVSPGSLELTNKLSMTGRKEDKVTYPEFYRLLNGDLLFFYRDGSSGNGNLMINYYDTARKNWMQLHDGLISGEGRRNAYWQTAIDTNGLIHLSWVWRETSDVATNHDICYARSTDGGITWEQSTGERYFLPITAGTAEYACRIPTNSELINQTSMCADTEGRPYIATYWRPQDTRVPQYFLVYHDGRDWRSSQVSQRYTPFTLKGAGSKRIPISRPQIVAKTIGDTQKAYMIFRDIERGNRVSVAICDDLSGKQWLFADLTTESVGLWEPSYDTELWNLTKDLHIFVQNVGQGDGETLENVAPQMVNILEWRPE